jgi:hypothetical protein
MTGTVGGSQVAVVELSNVESFSFLFKCIWSPSEILDGRSKLNVLDVILFDKGVPFRWLFTSSKTGDIMKKKSEKLNSMEIIKSLKSRAHSLSCDKHALRSIVATVWYLDTSNNTILSYVVDEFGLVNLFEDKYSSDKVLAIQVYLNGWPLKGSGVFEHRITMDSEGRRQYETTEFVNPPDDSHVTTYSTGIRKLFVTETQHNAIKILSRKLLKVLEIRSKTTVASIVIQVVFDSSWIPYIVTAKNIVLCDASYDWFTRSRREEMVYASGVFPLVTKAQKNQLELKKLEEDQKILDLAMKAEVKILEAPIQYFGQVISRTSSIDSMQLSVGAESWEGEEEITVENVNKDLGLQDTPVISPNVSCKNLTSLDEIIGLSESIVGIDEIGKDFPRIVDQSVPVRNLKQELHIPENEDDDDVLNSSNRLNYELLMAATIPASILNSVSFDNQSKLKSYDETMKGMGQTASQLIDLSIHDSTTKNMEEAQNGSAIPVLLSDQAKEGRTYLVDTEASKMRSTAYSLQVYRLVCFLRVENGFCNTSHSNLSQSFLVYINSK